MGLFSGKDLIGDYSKIEDNQANSLTLKDFIVWHIALIYIVDLYGNKIRKFRESQKVKE